MSAKLTGINGGNKPQPFADALRKMREQLDLLVEFRQLDAKLRRSHFEALKREGFTEQQALDICKAVML